NDFNMTGSETPISLDALRQLTVNMNDAEFIERQINNDEKVTLLYIRTLIDQERLNESIIKRLIDCPHESIYECMTNSKLSSISTLEEAQKQLMNGFILLYELKHN